MSVQHHDLVHEFPEHREAIHQLKMGDAHFRKLFEEYHQLTREIEKMEDEVTPTSTAVEEKAKTHRVYLKDQLLVMLKKSA